MLNVAILCSKRAPGLEALLRHPSRGTLYEIDCLVTTEPSFSECGVPVTPRPIREFYGDVPIGDRNTRRRYDSITAELLRYIGIDFVITLGYLYVLTEPMLTAFNDRILNVHDSDLPRYPGLHATRDAISAGEKETRSSVHLVTPDVDAGPVIARSEAFPVASFAREAARSGYRDIVSAYAYAHREWMMRRSWGDLVVSALEEVSTLAEAAV
jgi:folate-dependent phosphoribosylglycinamide formyltransferase PurN